MTPGVLLMLVAGLLLATGFVLALGALLASPALPKPPSTQRRRDGALANTPLVLGGIAVGVVIFLLTGWPVAGLGAAAAVIFVPGVLGGGKAAQQELAKSEALSDWTRRLSDLIGSGAASSTVEALRRTMLSVPETIAPAVTNLVSRIRPQGTEPALRQFAREVDHPAADKIAMVLILRERNGGPGLAEVLTALADDLDERARMVRDVEAERAKPRANMRLIVILAFILVTLMTLFVRPFLEPYSSIIGQIVLLVDVVLFGAALRWMQRISRPGVRDVVLVDPQPIGVRV